MEAQEVGIAGAEGAVDTQALESSAGAVELECPLCSCHSSQLGKRSAMFALLLPPTRSSNGLRQKGLWSLKGPRLIQKISMNLLLMRLACFPRNRLAVLSLSH